MSVSTIQNEHIYFAISPEGDFLVEFKVVNLDEQELSYRKFSSIHNDTKLPFTETQYDCIKNVPKPIVRWSVAVSDKSTNSSKFRLLAISCISLEDMKYYEENYDKIDPTEIQNIQNNRFTFIFIINNDNSIDNTEDKELLIKYGGIVKLFYEKDYIADKNADVYFLIILTLSGIYKYLMKNKSIFNIQKLKYPKRIYNSIVNNVTFFFTFDLNAKGIKYIELYDLKTNQLINTFKRQILYKSILWNYPSYYALSNNNKLLAYLSFPIKGITIYSIECGLEIAELANILDTSIFKTVNAIDRMFLYFFQNDEKLLIYYLELKFSSAVWAAWDIFNQQKFILKFLQFDDSEIEVEKSNSCIVIYQRDEDDKHDKLFIYDNLIVDKYFNLKESDKQNWIIRDLEDLDKKSELKLDELDKLYDLEDDIQYSFYLDEKKEKLFIIGYHTVQVWYKGTLKFIHSPSPFFDIPDHSEWSPSWRPKKIEVISIKYFRKNFKFNIKVKDAEGIKQIKMDDEDEINVAKNACYTLEYFSVYKKKFEQDICFDLMSTLIKAGELELVNYILFFGEPVHILQYFLWLDKENSKYYSNYAVHNIGWMNTVVDIIPELFKKSYKYYAQKLFYSPCFSDKEFDLFSFDILEVSLKSNDLLKVYIPITQLIPQNSELDLQEIKISDIKKEKITNFLEILFSPSRYLSPEETSEKENPFSNIIDSILAVYDWSSISFDTWNLWQLTIISVIGSFIFVIILQNVIISFMSEAFSDTVKDSKHGLYCYQIDLIHEFALLEKSLEFNDIDSKFKDKIRAKYICFYDDLHITNSWKKKSEQIRLKLYPKIQTLDKSEYESLSTEEDIYSLFS
ncbi:33193_t:CDS:10 [Gigaspora margarita]|uniref:33193_t:CDS:1 n=1 Tax=Gigaspora margarita TaxID=4874 RepID=A0ABM8W497_GIGMA|nr:33193_t:CDS:10 [Gigaspora margarita]